MSYEDDGAVSLRIAELRKELKELRTTMPLDEARIEEVLDEIAELTGSRA
jgi:hypothetical protein